MAVLMRGQSSRYGRYHSCIDGGLGPRRLPRCLVAVEHLTSGWIDVRRPAWRHALPLAVLRFGNRGGSATCFLATADGSALGGGSGRTDAIIE